jgi:predicted transcriptional regulator
MKNRSSSEIIPSILDACIGGSRITNIMLKSELTHGQTRAYLTELLGAGYLTLDADEANIYTSTPDGLRYLRVQTELQALMGPIAA